MYINNHIDLTRTVGTGTEICAVSRATAIQGGRQRVLAGAGAGLGPGPTGCSAGAPTCP